MEHLAGDGSERERVREFRKMLRDEQEGMLPDNKEETCLSMGFRMLDGSDTLQWERWRNRNAMLPPAQSGDETWGGASG